MASAGHGSHELHFSHPEVGNLSIFTGADRIAWGYNLNAVTYPTYAGEVVQILSCYIDDLTISGSVQTYKDMEEIYTYFLRYTQIATQGDPARTKQVTGRTSYNQEPITFTYAHRGWSFDVMPTSAPGFRKARDQIHPEWQVRCHVVDETGDADEIKQLILQEVEIKAAVGSRDQNWDENFGLKGAVTFMDENPFSDPFTEFGQNFQNERGQALTELADHYSKLLPAYLDQDFEAIFGNLGSQPAFNPKQAVANNAAKPDQGLTTALDKTYDRIIKAAG